MRERAPHYKQRVAFTLSFEGYLAYRRSLCTRMHLKNYKTKKFNEHRIMHVGTYTLNRYLPILNS